MVLKGVIMKKIFVYLFAFILCLAGGVGLLTFDNLNTAHADDITYNEIFVNEENFLSVMGASSTYNNTNVKLTLEEDINITNVGDISSLYTTLNIFNGVFDGKGYEIKNLVLSSTTSYYGLFPYAQNATIENVRVAGSVTFDFDNSSNSPIYAGILVGYGENVHMQNCELYNVVISSQENPEEPGTSIAVRTEEEIELPVYSNITFGGLIGVATSLTSSGENLQSVIENCVNYYDFNVEIIKNNRIAVGGIVGYLTNGSKLINCLNYGNIAYVSDIELNSDSIFNKYIGGICGEIDGTSTSIKNTGFGGEIILPITDINCYAGTIVGYLNCQQASSNYNVNFSYWTQGVLQFYGSGYRVNSDKLGQVALINRSFLSNSDNFDTIESGFDFNYTWAMIDSQILLQNFQEYTFNFNTSHYDNGNIIDSAQFSIGSDVGSEQITAKYGKTITITITYAENYAGYYSLSSVLLNSLTLDEENYTATATTNASGAVNGYKIEIFACDMTDGTYSFSLYGNTYYCEIEISDEAKENSQGTIRSVGTGASSTTYMNPGFTYSNRTLNIQAEGNDIYTFSYWEIYYKDASGLFTIQGTLSDEQRESAVANIIYGTPPYDREFRLIAYFTDEDAISVTIGNFDETMISSVTLRGITYEGQNINVPYNSTNVTLVVVTNPGYVMDVTSFTSFIQRLYGTNSTDGLASEPVTNAEGQTTYQYTLNMRYMQNGLTDNQLALTLYVVEDETDNGDPLLWVYIVVPIIAVIIIGIVIFLIIRRKGGGKTKEKVKKEKKKEENYRDYYV